MQNFEHVSPRPVDLSRNDLIGGGFLGHLGKDRWRGIRGAA
ncbi:hypothetical protein X772_20340 [Mesorhizobium sp. LSJC280B00]|nr:hypothetical protein X772_20340 [Mesorhizobium sp. LSJC280B00]